MHDVDSWRNWQERDAGINWQEPEVFQATLELREMRRDGHAVYYLWEDVVGNQYPMLAKDFFELVMSSDIKDGRVYASWQVVKRGRAYGIKKVGLILWQPRLMVQVSSGLDMNTASR